MKNAKVWWAAFYGLGVMLFPGGLFYIPTAHSLWFLQETSHLFTCLLNAQLSSSSPRIYFVIAVLGVLMCLMHVVLFLTCNYWLDYFLSSIGYPVVTLGFGFKSYVSYKMRLRKQKEVQKENEFYMQLLQQALPPEQQMLQKPDKESEEGRSLP